MGKSEDPTCQNGGRLPLGVPHRPTDFDALLAALGAADAEPPPLMKQLLAKADAPRITHDPDRRAIAELEAWLSALIHERSARQRP